MSNFKVTATVNCSVTVEFTTEATSERAAKEKIMRLLAGSDFSLIMEDHPSQQVQQTEFAEIDPSNVQIAQVRAVELAEAADAPPQAPAKPLLARRLGERVILEFLRLRRGMGNDVAENREVAVGSMYDLANELSSWLLDLYNQSYPNTISSIDEDDDDDDGSDMAWW
jgi:hypothetical protein